MGGGEMFVASERDGSTSFSVFFGSFGLVLFCVDEMENVVLSRERACCVTVDLMFVFSIDYEDAVRRE